MLASSQFFLFKTNFEQGKSGPDNSKRGKRSSTGLRGVSRFCAALALTMVAGCAVHPIPDDRSPIPTEAIVVAARCEMRLGLLDMVDVWYKDVNPPIDKNKIPPETLGEEGSLKKLGQLYPSQDIPGDWQQYMDISMAFDWTFDITETNAASSSLGFKLPFVHPGSLDVSTGASVTAVRHGKRTFKHQETLGNLLTRRWKGICEDDYTNWRSKGAVPNGSLPRPERLLYPVTGSMGLAKAIETFLRLAAQDNGSDTFEASDAFTDELTFTTTVGADIGAGIALSPVTREFRLVSGSVALGGSRIDMHKVKISFAFPTPRPLTPKEKAAKLDKSIEGGRQLNTKWRAQYALCVVEARAREAELKVTRLEPPEVSCLASTDAFFARGNEREHDPHAGVRPRSMKQHPPATVSDRKQRRFEGARPARRSPLPSRLL